MQMPDTFSVLEYDRTLVLAIELSSKCWVVAAQVPGLPHAKAKRTVKPTVEALIAAIDGYRSRTAAAGRIVESVIAPMRQDGLAFGWSAGWRGAVSRRTSSSPPVYPLIAGLAGPNPMGLMPNCCCAPCSLGCAANRACARWFRFRAKPTRMLGAAFGKDRNSSLSELAS